MRRLRQLDIQQARQKNKGTSQTLRLIGSINARTNPEFELALGQCLKFEKSDLVLNMEQLKYLNSTGLSTLIHYHQAFSEESRELILVQVPRHIAIVISQMGLQKIVPIFNEESEAYSFLGGNSSDHRVFKNWKNYLNQVSPEKRKVPKPRMKRKRAVMLVEPQMNELTAVLKLRLHNSHTDFITVSNPREAIEKFNEIQPEVIVIRHTGMESDELINKIKMDLGHPLVSITKIYPSRIKPNDECEFKIWENDYFVEPFSIIDLFSLAENEILRIQSERELCRHQMNYRFLSNETQISRSRELTKHLIRQTKLSEEKITRFLSAYDEAVDNARRHGHADDPTKNIEIIYSADRESISTLITDEGKGFDHREWTKNLKDTTAVNQVRLSRKKGKQGGLGILLMRKCCSRISYLGEGNSILLEQSIDHEKTL